MIEMSRSETEDGDRPITVSYVLELLNSPMKLGRERGIVKLDKLLKSWEQQQPSAEYLSEEILDGKEKLQSAILQALLAEEEDVENRRSSCFETEEQTDGSDSRRMSRSSSMSEDHSKSEQKHGYLMACYPLISFSTTADKGFLLKIRDASIRLLRHHSIRVQLAAGGVLGFMCKHIGPEIYEASREVVLDLITENLNTVCIISEEEALKSAEQGFDVNLPAVVIRQKVIKESLGWNHLEPSLKCLHFMIENLGSEFIPFMEPKIITLTFKCLQHPIRYVRETGYQICTSLLMAAPEDIKEIAHQLSGYLAAGLSDNWNQVRMAASVATRGFFAAFVDNKEDFYAVLLPKLCLNRYYTAEGIRVYVQDSWKRLVVADGRQLVAKYMADIVNCYLESTKSTNLAEREAACACISELATKLDRKAVLPYATPMLDALIVCAKNESWSVRDAACLSVGNFLVHYPVESKASLEVLYSIFFDNLRDPIRLLRQGAATALSNIAEAYGEEALKVILPVLTTGLNGIDQMAIIQNTEDLVKHGYLEDRGHEEDACAQHEPQCELAVPGKIFVSSHSLLKALETSSIPECLPSTCISCRRSKIPQPWHFTDGCLYLVGTLSTSVPDFKTDLQQLLPFVIKSTTIRNYPEHLNILETFCRILPLIARALGQKPFKYSLQEMLEPIFYTIESINPVISSTGRECLTQLGNLLGPNILRSRIELYDPKFVSLIPE